MRFTITPGELEYAERIPAQFKLYLVSEIDSAILKYQELPSRFLGRRLFRIIDVVERIEVKFKQLDRILMSTAIDRSKN